MQFFRFSRLKRLKAASELQIPIGEHFKGYRLDIPGNLCDLYAKMFL
jgi:hypothetical protein